MKGKLLVVNFGGNGKQPFILYCVQSRQCFSAVLPSVGMSTYAKRTLCLWSSCPCLCLYLCVHPLCPFGSQMRWCQCWVTCRFWARLSCTAQRREVRKRMNGRKARETEPLEQVSSDNCCFWDGFIFFVFNVLLFLTSTSFNIIWSLTYLYRSWSF